MPKPKQTFAERAREWFASKNPLQRTLSQAEQAAGAKKEPAYRPATDIPFGVRTDPSKSETMPKASPSTPPKKPYSRTRYVK